MSNFVTFSPLKCFGKRNEMRFDLKRYHCFISSGWYCVSAVSQFSRYAHVLLWKYISANVTNVTFVTLIFCFDIANSTFGKSILEYKAAAAIQFKHIYYMYRQFEWTTCVSICWINSNEMAHTLCSAFSTKIPFTVLLNTYVCMHARVCMCVWVCDKSGLNHHIIDCNQMNSNNLMGRIQRTAIQ